MKVLFTILLLSASYLVSAQSIADFENFELEVDQSDIDGHEDGGYISGEIFFPNNYNPDFNSWTDWAISSLRDTITEGFLNSLSSYAGSGKASQNYAVAAAFQAVKLKLLQSAQGKTINGLYISNNTYAALSMKNGDSFAKKFGGESGNDPDYFKISIRKWLNGERSTDSIDFYLADFRFEDNNLDYILKDWAYVDLESLGAVDSLEFAMSSSDVGAFGMNTPAIFCLDNVLVDIQSSTEELSEARFNLFPNPSSDFLYLDKKPFDASLIQIYDLGGRKIYQGNFDGNKIDISFLDKGVYNLRIPGYLSKQFIKI